MDRRIVFVISLIETDITRPYNLESLAKLVNLSPSRLRHLFKADKGMTVTQFQKEARLEQAQELLTTTFLSVKEVMNRIGFTDHSYFIREFKKAYGLTPTAYRDGLRKPPDPSFQISPANFANE